MTDELLASLRPELAELDFVEWDRFTRGTWGNQPFITVYGWIDREDVWKDFVVILRWEDGATYFTTSSAEHTHRIHEVLFPDDGLDDHNDCIRVEDHLDIPNAVRLRHDGGNTLVSEVRERGSE